MPWIRILQAMASVTDICECEVVSPKMSTFVSAILPFETKCYGKFMSTFVYQLEKDVFSKIKQLTSKHVYFRLLLHTFQIRRGGVFFGINGLTATDA